MVFAITRFVPGGPIERMIAQAQQMQQTQGRSIGPLSAEGRNQPLSDEQIAQLKKYYGFDKPILVSYFLWLGKVLSGDLGVSTRYYDPVWEMIKERIPFPFISELSLPFLYMVFAFPWNSKGGQA